MVGTSQLADITVIRRRVSRPLGKDMPTVHEKASPTLSWAKRRSSEMFESFQNFRGLHRGFRKLRRLGTSSVHSADPALDIPVDAEILSLSSSCPLIHQPEDDETCESFDRTNEISLAAINLIGNLIDSTQNHPSHPHQSHLEHDREKYASNSSSPTVVRLRSDTNSSPITHHPRPVTIAFTESFCMDKYSSSDSAFQIAAGQSFQHGQESNTGDASNFVKIKINDLTPSNSQEFIGSGQRRPPTPSSLASTPSKSSSTGSFGGAASYSHTNIEGTTAKRCAKRNSAASFTAGNCRPAKGTTPKTSVKRRKSWTFTLGDGASCGSVERRQGEANQGSNRLASQRSISLVNINSETESVLEKMAFVKFHPGSLERRRQSFQHQTPCDYGSESRGDSSVQNDSQVQFEKPRSLSASSGDAIFMESASKSIPSRIQDQTSCIRSLNDIRYAKDGLNDLCGSHSSRSGSNSSSRESICATSSVNIYLTPPTKTSLHKSISTPSILAAQEAAESGPLTKKGDKSQKSSNEMKSSAASSSAVFEDSYDYVQHLAVLQYQPSPYGSMMVGYLPENLSYTSNQESDDEKSISKRKKRGSLFFRKRRGKEKDKEVKKSPHQFVSVSFSIPALCDVCRKSLANKTAIKCENCMVTVHDSSCKDQILDCNKFRLAKKPNHLALNTKDKTISPMLQVPPGSGSKNSSPTSSVKEKKSSSLISGKSFLSSSVHGSSSEPASSFAKPPPPPSSPSTTRKSYTPSGYSQWRRVATKLGVNKVICEDKELDTGEDSGSNIIEANSGSLESLDEGTQAEVAASVLEDDNILRLLEEEPESWTNTVDKKVLKRLKEKDIKRQEVIHELIVTEKHHCLTLKIMQKIYAQGMIKELHMTKDMVERIFPCLEDLLDAHSTFLRKLRDRQSEDSVIENIGDIIKEQFSGRTGEKLRVFYGHFCSQHKEALSLYKDILKTDRKFQNFVKKCSIKPLCKTRGIPECILLVTQRITKYPLLIDSLLKVTRDSKSDYANLKEALKCIKEIINKVDAQVAEKEKEIRLLEIYNKVDAKSTTIFRGKKFRKSDLLSNNRKLRHEFVLSWKSARGKIVDVIAVILSDVIILLQETNQKYHFCSLDNKSGVVALQKLLVREKAGQSSKGVYLISSNPHEPEMYELICPTAKDQKILIDQLRDAVDKCPNECEINIDNEDRKIEEARKAKVRELLNSMYEKDARMAKMCEEKMKVFSDIMEIMGVEQEGLDMIRYVPITDDNNFQDMAMNAAHEALRIAHNLYISGTNLSRSVSSAGEHHSEAFVSPILPKRAETFGGFDNPLKDQSAGLTALKKKLVHLKDTTLTGTKENDSNRGESDSCRETNLSSNSPPATCTDTFLQIRGSTGEIRRSSGPLPGKCSSGTSSPEKVQRRSLVTTPTASTQSLFLNSNILAPISPTPTVATSTTLCSSTFFPLYDLSDIYRLSTTPLLMTQGKDQLIQIAELQHQVNLLMCFFNYQQTLFENMRFQLLISDSQNKLAQQQKENNSNYGNNGKEALSTNSSFSRGDRRSVYRPEQGLEELRNLQEQLRAEKSDWQKKLCEEKLSLEEERKSLSDLRQQIKQEQKDIEEQREMLYRKLEALQKEGIILSPAHTVVTTGNPKVVVDSPSSFNPPKPPPLPPLPSSSHRTSEKGANRCLPDEINPVRTSFLHSPRSNIITSLANNNNNVSPVKNSPNMNIGKTPPPKIISGCSNQVIRQQLPLKLAVNENSTQTRCSVGQPVLVASGQPIPTNFNSQSQNR